MEIRKMRGEAAVDLFGKRIMLLPRAQACFDMANRYVAVVRSKRRSKGRGRVSLDKEQGGAFPSQDRIESRYTRRRNVGKALSSLHHSQIIVRAQAENSQHLVEHFLVLPSDADLGLEVSPMLLQFQHYRRQLDRLG